MGARRNAGLALLLAAALAAVPAVRAEPPAGAARTTSVFDLPALQRELSGARTALARGNERQAIARLQGAARKFPDQPDPWTMLAVLHGEAGREAPALDALERAVELGFDGVAGFARSKGGQAVAGAPRFAEIAERAAAAEGTPGGAAFAPAEPALLELPALAARIEEANTEFDTDTGVFRSLFEIPPVLRRRPVLADTPGLASFAPFLNRWYVRGLAAGNIGDLYDNRDRNHSPFPEAGFRQLARVVYGEAARARDLDYGPAGGFEFDRITFGNSSTAIVKGPYWRSQARRQLLEPEGPTRLFRQYSRNQIYVYPATEDVGPTRGDLMPAAVPYYVTSVGKSYSDQPFLRAIALALAALKPEVKTRLRETGLVAPTLQRLLRRTLRGVESEADYLTPAAHPVAFDGARIDEVRLVKAAQALEIGEIPPMVRLAVLRESPALEGRDHFSGGTGETLFDTPGAIARVHRRAEGVRRITLSARQTRPLGQEPLRFVWRVLRGDAERIEIVPREADGSVVEITIPWHEPAPLPGAPAIRSSRVDIAAFAVAGGGHSAPAFLSVLFPRDQVRRYGEDGRVLEIDYSHPSKREVYADPAVFPLRPWRDVYRYGPGGTPLGWTRQRAEGAVRYTPAGEKVLSLDGRGRPLEVMRVRYEVAERDPETGRARIVVRDTGERLRYAYDGPEDLAGWAVPVSSP